METLLQIAKRLGIKPNPRMTDEEYKKIQDLIIQELKKIGRTSEDHLDDIIYDFHKKTPSGIAQHFDHAAFENNLSRFEKESLPGVKGFPQEGSFWWHDARDEGIHTSERFVADLKLDDPNISAIFEKLDEFILRHHSGYKIVMSGNRTDTLNMYMPKPITPEVAKEFYEIVKPVLQTKNHAYLDGFSIKQGGREIRGIKFGPEPLRDVSMKEDFEPMKKRLESVLPRSMLHEVTRQYCGRKSLGQVAAKVQLCDFLYYLVGREGQNPIQLGNQLGIPGVKYDKKIDIGDVESPEKTPVSKKHQRQFQKQNCHLL